MRNRYFIKYVTIALFLVALWVAGNNSVGSSEPDQSVSNLVQLIQKLTKRIEALEQLVQILEAKVQALEAEKGKGETIECFRILRVIDGDTVLISSGETVRYIGIDTPEKNEPLRGESIEANKSLVEGKQVRLEYDIRKQGKWGRTLAYVYVDDTFVNCELLLRGLAEINTYGQSLKHLDSLIACQWEAIKNQRGIWKGVQDIVYVTPSGRKYHTERCHHLKGSAIPTTRQKAIAQGYAPCKVCKP